MAEALMVFDLGEAELEAAIAEGEADLAAGRVVPFEEVVRDLEEKIAAARAKQP